MSDTIHYTPCQIRQVEYVLATLPCDRCGGDARRVDTARRTAIDIDLDQPTLLSVHVSVHHCPVCQHYLRAQPPFLRPDAIYTQRVVRKAVESVIIDGMAFRRVGDRLARDFCVQPSEAMVRRWCRAYATSLALDSYDEWVVAEFSGVLCVDEVYQHDVALLLAVDPGAPEGDRIVGYHIANAGLTAETVRAFLERLAGVGIQPEEVITDASTLYPTVVAEVWPQAAHQLCLFHETRRLTAAAGDVLRHLRRSLPTPPPAVGRFGHRGRPCTRPQVSDPTDPAFQHWYAREHARHTGIRQVQALAAQGLSQRAVARQLGLGRHTVRRWLTLEAPPTLSPLPLCPPPAAHPRRVRRTAALVAQMQELAAQGASYVEIARQTGAHRVTVSGWLRQPDAALVPSEEADPIDVPLLAPPDPPAPWTTWEEVRRVRDALKEQRGLLLRRPEHLSDEHQALLETLLVSPLGPELSVVRTFLTDWYAIWQDAAGQRRTLDDATAHYEDWHEGDDATFSSLRRVRAQVTPGRFLHLSQFLRHPTWEATNNGAERAGRLFRHQQGPHFTLRTTGALDHLLRARLQQRQAHVTTTVASVARCSRGRRVGRSQQARAA